MIKCELESAKVRIEIENRKLKLEKMCKTIKRRGKRYKCKQVIMCVVERTARNITVRMTRARWNRLMELEEAYRTARAVLRAKRECEKAPSMTVAEALSFVDGL